MSVLRSQVNARSAEFRANAERMGALVSDLKGKVAAASVGGEKSACDKHTNTQTPLQSDSCKGDTLRAY